MSSHKKHAHLEKIKEAIAKRETMSQSEKTQTIRRIEEWVTEDKAEGILYTELIELVAEMKDVLGELGLK